MNLKLAIQLRDGDIPEEYKDLVLYPTEEEVTEAIDEFVENVVDGVKEASDLLYYGNDVPLIEKIYDGEEIPDAILDLDSNSRSLLVINEVINRLEEERTVILDMINKNLAELDEQR